MWGEADDRSFISKLAYQAESKHMCSKQHEWSHLETLLGFNTTRIVEYENLCSTPYCGAPSQS